MIHFTRGQIKKWQLHTVKIVECPRIRINNPGKKEGGMSRSATLDIEVPGRPEKCQRRGDDCVPDSFGSFRRDVNILDRGNTRP